MATAHHQAYPLALHRNAASYAVERYNSLGDQPSASEGGMQAATVTRSDFFKALGQLEPAYGLSKTDLRRRFLPVGLVDCGAEHRRALGTMNGILEQLHRHNAPAQSIHVLLKGPSGRSKQRFAAFSLAGTRPVWRKPRGARYPTFVEALPSDCSAHIYAHFPAARSISFFFSSARP